MECLEINERKKTKGSLKIFGVFFKGREVKNLICVGNEKMFLL
jgi:hypothetical protein